jgi:hypothetical protein
MRKVLNVSLADNDNGYLQYLDANNKIITLYKNTAANRAYFLTNDYSTENVMLIVSDGITTSNPEILIEKIVSFNIETFCEDRNYVKVSTLNNKVEPVNYDDIRSLRILLIFEIESKRYQRFALIPLNHLLDLTPGSIEYGTDYIENKAFPFSAFGSYAGFILTNISIFKDSLLVDEADSAIITTESETIKIRNTGQYFSSVQDAIDAAVSGSEILIGAGSYEEPIILKAGIKLYGGYNVFDWTRDTSKNKSIIKTKAGITDTTIEMANNTVLDGLVLDGSDLAYGVYASNLNQITISNCEIYNVDIAIYFKGNNLNVKNNSVTSNTSSLYLNSSYNINIYRNRLYCRNKAGQPNIVITSTSGTNFKNNAVIGGSQGLKGESAAVNIINNVFTKVENITINGNSACNLYVANNIIFDNNFGIYCPNSAVTVEYNYFAQNRFGNYGIDNPGTIEGGNLIDTDSYDWGINDPVFENISDFVLKGNSVCIDTGKSSSQYLDLYLEGNPSQGDSNNDMGIYGGPLAGRLGQGQTIYVTSANNLSTMIDNAWPGDFLALDEGDFSITNQSLKDSQTLIGKSPFLTRLTNTGLNGLMLESNNKIEELAIIGDGTDTAVIADSKTGIEIKNILLITHDQGIYINNSEVKIRNITCSENNTAVTILGSSSKVSILNSIFASSGIYGIVNNSDQQLEIANTLFYNNSTDVAGDIAQTNSVEGTLPIFWDAANFYYNLHPSSNAINKAVDAKTDLGCFEYYLNIGQLESQVVTTNTAKLYKSLKAEFYSNAESETPTFAPGLFQIEAAYVINDVASTISPVITVTNNAESSYTWNLFPRAVGSKIKLRLALKSYQFHHTPHLNKLILSW